jgi:hypothetical protein
MKFRFSFLTGLSAFLIASCAAYYSVFGLSHLFAGASIAVILMASCLEFSKIIAVSFLQRYWNKVSKSLKTYMAICVIVLVCITSAGIYGFLSNAYQQTSNKMEILDGRVNILKNKSNSFDARIKDNQVIIASKNKRIELLNTVRLTQENRLTEATQNYNKRSIRNDISSASAEITKLNDDIDKLNIINSSLSDSVNKYKTEMITSQSGSEVASDIGPLKYLSALTGYPMDKIVNIFILLLIFVFDPLAVALVVATNKIMQIDSEEKNSLPRYEKTNTETPAPVKENEPQDNTLLEVTPQEVDTNILNEPDYKYDQEPVLNELKPELVEDSKFESDDKIIVNNDEPIDEPGEQLTKYIPYEPVVPNGRIDLESIKEKKANRGFSIPIPTPHSKHNNAIERLKSDVNR